MPETDQTPQIRYRETEEIQQILGRPPGWLLRWGITLVLLTTLLLLALGWIYRYPDILTAPVVLQTERPPTRLVAPVSAPIAELLIADGDTVGQDQLLLMLQGPLSRRTVERLQLELRRLLEQQDPTELAALTLPDVPRLSGLQADYAALRGVLTDLKLATEQVPWKWKREALRTQIAQLEALNQSLDRQEKTLGSEVEIAFRNFEQYNALLQRGAASELEFEEAQTTYLRYRRELENMQTRQIDNQLAIARLEAEIIELRQTERQAFSGFETDARARAQALLGQLQQWEEQHLIRAPYAGRVTFTGLEAEKQYVGAGEELLTLLPPAGREVSAQARLSAAGLGKVQRGTPAQIRLDGYPYQEFGVLNGQVTTIALAPSLEPGLAPYYRLTIELTDGLTTTYGRPIDFKQQMSGQARLITENRSLLARLFDRLLSLRKNRPGG